MEFTCPTCNVLLQQQKLEDIRILKCESCSGFAISLPIVRKSLEPPAFKRIWQKLFAGDIEKGRPCPGCKQPLSVVDADGQSGVIKVDVCRSCHIFWFDHEEFSGLPKVASKAEKAKQSESRLLTPVEIGFAAFKEDQNRRKSFLYKLLDGSVSKEMGLEDYFGGFFDR